MTNFKDRAKKLAQSKKKITQSPNTQIINEKLKKEPHVNVALGQPVNPNEVEPHKGLYARKEVLTNTVNIPFDTHYIEDNNLHLEEREMTFKGELGKQTMQTIIYLDDNNEIVYSVNNLLKYVPPKARLIRVGTLPNVNRNTYFSKKYKALSTFATPIMPSVEPMIGFDDIMDSITMYINKDGMSNVVLLADPGMGKTATMQAYADKYKESVSIFTISMAAMNEHNRLSQNLEELFEDLIKYKQELKDTTRDIVIFIDEFHQWAMYSPASIESLKPQLARSAKLGIHIVGATTYDEYRQWVRDNAAFADRFPALNLPHLTDDQTYEVLKLQLQNQTVVDKNSDASKAMLRKMVHYTNLHMPNRAQPRKSKDVLDMCLAYVKIGKFKFDDRVLERVFYDTVNVQLQFTFNATKLKSTILSMVFDQLYAVDQVIGRCYSIMLNVVDDTKPLGSFLFQGSTGVGKSELAKALGKTLFGDDAKISIYDMGEFAPDDKDAPRRFQTTITDDMIERRSNIILCDEIEKAHPEISKMFYSILDEGRLSDKNGRRTSFANVIFIFTTNVGENISADFAQRNLSAEDARIQIQKSAKTIRKALETNDAFPKALLGRINAIVPFVPLTKATNEKISERRLIEMTNRFLHSTGVTVSLKMDDLVNYITLEKFNPDPNAGGARQIKNRIDSDITDKISEYILFHPNDHHIEVSVDGKTIRDHHINESEAEIVIKGYAEHNTPKEVDDLEQFVTAMDDILEKEELEIMQIHNAVEDAVLGRNVELMIHNIEDLRLGLLSLNRNKNTYLDDMYIMLKDFIDEYFKNNTYVPGAVYTVGFNTKTKELRVVPNKRI